MARDSDGLPVRKWAKSETALALAPTDITPADGLPASYGVDSFISLEVFNYLWRQVTALGEDVAKHGVLEWDASQEYLHPSFVIGSDNNLYQSVQANTAQDPTIDDGTYWTQASSLDIVNASETVPGIIRTATTAEVLAGTSVSTAVTPADLAAVTTELLSTAADGLTSEPGEYVLSRGDGGRTWPWNTTKGRAVLAYEPTAKGVINLNTLNAIPNVITIDYTGGAYRGVATDGETIWASRSNLNSDTTIVAWTIDGARNSDKDITISRSNDFGGGTTQLAGMAVLDDKLLVVTPGRNDTYYIVSISIADADYGTVDASFITGNRQTRPTGRKDTATDGTTIWLLLMPGTLQAYSANGVRDTTKDIDLTTVSNSWLGVATDGVTIWAFDENDNAAKGWDIATLSRDVTKDIFFGSETGNIADSLTLPMDIHGSTLYFFAQNTNTTPKNVVTYQLPKPRKLTVGSNVYETVGQNEVTGASIGDTIRADLQEDDDFAIVYPVY